MSRNKIYSFRKRLSQIMRILMLLQVVGFFLYSLFFTFSMRSRVYDEIRQTLEMYNTELSTNLKSVDYYLVEINNYNTDISTLSGTDNPQEHYGSISGINRLFDTNLRSFPNILGLYCYFPNNGTWVENQKSSFQNDGFSGYLRNSLSNAKPSVLSSKTSTKWVLYPYQGKNYFVNFFVLNKSIVGAWTDTDTLSSALTRLQDQGADILFVNKQGRPLNVDSTNPLNIPVSRTLEHYAVLHYQGRRYMAVSVSLTYCDYFITAMIPLSQVDMPILSLGRILIFLLFCTVVLFWLVNRLLSQFIKESIDPLVSVTKSLAGGNMDSRINTSDQPCSEILEISESYNQMIDTIQQLKIDVYEENLQKKTFELQYLKSQVAPHFLINCLNTISYLTDGTREHADLIKRMIVTLSEHLRYTLSTEDKVPLDRELHYEKNYIELTSLRFPGCITFCSDIDDEVRNAMVFPLILIMITENTFKLNLVMGEPLKLTLSIHIINRNDEKRLIITHIDSGSGYPQEILDKYNHPDDQILAGSCAGTKIGISNLIKRLRLYYDNTAVLHLSNEPGMGARTEIDIPFVAYTPETQK